MGKSKSVYIRRALEERLDEQQDYLIALQRLEENLPPIPWEAALHELNLPDEVRPKSPH
jgi:hypothetical protein